MLILSCIQLFSRDEQRRIVAYLDGLQAKINALRELQSTSGEELSALMPSVLDKAFKGEL
jgi:type I restriction enzyme S subunit